MTGPAEGDGDNATPNERDARRFVRPRGGKTLEVDVVSGVAVHSGIIPHGAGFDFAPCVVFTFERPDGTRLTPIALAGTPAMLARVAESIRVAAETAAEVAARTARARAAGLN